MTTEPLDLDAVRERAKRSHAEIVALCAGERRWAMRIPAQPERDSDLVFSATVADVDALIVEVTELRRHVATLRERLAEREDAWLHWYRATGGEPS